MTTGPRTRQPSGGRRGGAGGFARRRRGRNAIKAEEIDYKDVQLMRRFVSERGKLVSGQRIGVTAKNQRRLARALKRAQHLALIPMAPNHTYVTGSVQTDAPRRAEVEEAESDAPAEQSEPAPKVVAESEVAEQETSDEAVKPAEEPEEQS